MSSSSQSQSSSPPSDAAQESRSIARLQQQRPRSALQLAAEAAEARQQSPPKKESRLRLRRRLRKGRSDSPQNLDLSSNTSPNSNNNNNNNNNNKQSKKSNKSESRASMSGRTVKFHRLFDIPASEILIRTFPCALKTEILLQGTFYVSASYFCFYARLANKRKTIKIPIRTVCEITREKIAIFFPNAIGIRTDTGCRYVFGSILSRENTLKLLLDLWKTALDPVINGSQPSAQAIETARRIFRSSSDSDLSSLHSSGAMLVKQKSQLNGDCRATISAALGTSSTATAAAIPPPSSEAGGVSDDSSSPQLTPAGGGGAASSPGIGTAAASANTAGGHQWSQFILQFVLFLKSHLSFIVSDNRMALGCILIVLCLAYVLYLAYQIHLIQQTISERLEELLQSSAILSPLVQR